MPREIRDDETLSHYGTPGLWSDSNPPRGFEGSRNGFRGKPYVDSPSQGMSVFIGPLSPAEMLDRVDSSGREPAATDAVRHTTARKLREAGFVVTHTPTKWKPDHVTVEFPGEWDEDVMESWHDCFGPATTYEDPNG